jgi:hypothetical protein
MRARGLSRLDSRPPHPSCHGAPGAGVLAPSKQEIGMSQLPIPAPVHAPRTDALADFVAHAQLMLDPATPEPARRAAEPHLLALLPALQVLGVFELFAIRDPALRALVRDELRARRTRAA